MTEKVKVCFILGAGFTCAYSAQAPTMANFLKQSEAAGVYKPDSDHKILAAIGEKYFGSPISANIEELATFLKVDHGSDPRQDMELRALAYDQLTLVIVRTLAFIHNKPRSERIKALFQDFANFVVRQGICVITFNYDLLFDQLLRNTNGWFPIDGYGTPIPLALTGVVGGAIRKLESTGRAENQGFGPLSKVALLKLHGSLNWGTRYTSKRDSKNQVELGMGGALPMPGDDTVGPIEVSSMGVRLGEGSSVNYFWRPFIVPPNIGSEPESGAASLLGEIWYAAKWLLGSVSDVHILGYSLPPSDFEADALIREGLYGSPARSVRKRVVVVNKDVSVIERFNRFSRSDVAQIVPSTKSDVADYLTDFLDSHQTNSGSDAPNST